MSITAFLPYSGQEFTRKTVAELQNAGVESIYLIANSGGATISGTKMLAVNGLTSTAAMDQIAKHATTDHALLLLHDVPIQLGQFALERMTSIADSTQS